MKILTLTDNYLPGYKAGGPVRSLANLIDRLGDEFHFKVITRDRDFGDVETYPGIVVGSWQPVSKAEVFYLTPQSLSLWALLRLIWATEKDVIYLHSFFSPVFTIKPLILRLLGGVICWFPMIVVRFIWQQQLASRLWAFILQGISPVPGILGVIFILF